MPIHIQSKLDGHLQVWPSIVSGDIELNCCQQGEGYEFYTHKGGVTNYRLALLASVFSMCHCYGDQLPAGRVKIVDSHPQKGIIN
ncbi:hypothetical protein [uncultured Shewanella sp.]|uniref:hypothetical protein n=1 Tax=uncultured Shewanella sp. TaxID=173975 RepID=UPI002611268D|nr:hypothetical protein [uncultured Shewanella sp.]